MGSVINFIKDSKPQPLEYFEAGDIIAAKVGSPNMLVTMDSGESVTVVYVEEISNHLIERTFPVEEMCMIFKAPSYDEAQDSWG